MKSSARVASLSALLLAVPVFAAELAPENAPKNKPNSSAVLAVPDESTIPQGPLGSAIRKGKLIVTETRRHTPENVGNGLNCTSCHLNGGTTPFAAPWIGIWGVFPEYRSRNAQVNSLQQRVNDCFERSMNGKPLDPMGEEMNAVLAYMWWLSRDIPTGVPVEGRGFKRIKPDQKPDKARGKALFSEKCASCHGQDGSGQTTPDGGYMFPAVWGPKSFNIGAGMARLNTAASFIQANMPLGQGGTLTNQEAFDIAAFMIEQPRPDFAKKKLDWPKGDKPSDARY